MTQEKGKEKETLFSVLGATPLYRIYELSPKKKMQKKKKKYLRFPL